MIMKQPTGASMDSTTGTLIGPKIGNNYQRELDNTGHLKDHGSSTRCPLLMLAPELGFSYLFDQLGEIFGTGD